MGTKPAPVYNVVHVCNEGPANRGFVSYPEDIDGKPMEQPHGNWADQIPSKGQLPQPDVEPKGRRKRII